MAPVLRIRAILGGWQGGPGINTWHFTTGTLPGEGFNNSEANEAADLVHSFYNTIKPHLINNLTVQLQPDAVVYDDATGVVAAVESLTARATVTGSAGQTQLSRATHIASVLRTNAVVGRRMLIGRHFIGPVGQFALTTGGQVDGTVGAAIAAAYNGMIDSPGEVDLCIWHRPKKVSGGDPPTYAGGVTKKVQAASFKSAPAVLRSRRD